MSSHLTIDRAASVMGVSPQTLRVGLQKGVFTFGTALKIPGSSRYKYVIFPKEFERLFGAD